MRKLTFRTGLRIDHIDENKENNHIDNLQLLTNRENCYKSRIFDRKNRTSKYLGVSWATREKKWNARKWIDGVYKSLGNFHSEDEAHLAFEKQ